LYWWGRANVEDDAADGAGLARHEALVGDRAIAAHEQCDLSLDGAAVVGIVAALAVDGSELSLESARLR